MRTRFRPGVTLREAPLETLCQKSVVGLLGVTLMNPG